MIIQETYPNLSNYGGEKYIYFETKKVREDPRAVEEATNEKDPIFDDDKTPEDEVKTPLMIRLTVMMMTR